MNFNDPFNASMAAMPSLFSKAAGFDTANMIDDKYFKKRMKSIYHYPASYKKALMHQNAYSFGYNSAKDDAMLCACCELPISTIPIPLCYGTTPTKDKIQAGKPKFMLDAGSTMFFNFIKITIAYLLLRFLIVDIYNIITNIIAYATLTQDET